MRADQEGTPDASPKGALDGIVVADFGRVLAGPYMTMLLADLGADVIKIERPGSGDDTRAWGPPFAGGEATYFLGVNRNKRSVSLDLTDPEDLATARAIVDRADVLVENFRPGTMERLGLGYEDVRASNPGLVYCSVNGFGTAEGARLPGYDLLVQAMGGLMSVTGEPDGPGTKAGVALVDVITGLHAGLGVLAALRHREHTGEGQRVEVSLLTSLLSALTNQAAAHLGAGVVPRAMGNSHPSIAPYEVFEARDRPLVLAVGTDRQFRTLCERLGRRELADDPRFATNTARVAHREELVEELSGPLGTRTADGWFEELSAAGVPCGPINDVAAAFDLADRLGLAPRVPEAAAGPGQVANPIRLDATPPSYRGAPPRLGEHTDVLLAALGRPARKP
ncbi:CAIB or BAIF family protein [Streptomyces venezuelae]|uniref:CaiB/BaiF CoA transferase family protein n=1 Tax=Streptomyces gardneri TaxID=66892 RepID=UPI0006BD9A80|nr:CoA transferase [Streptomyces gardneri]ALO06421.1 CAIB or BAIF family protein [Streptomyces venezuelae]QPK43863.1 CoA transferase [Streptomyces gardneri]WRK35123.1 CoA transferase [Streptomyces venezuelae]CUM43317.1 CAIB/BAIF family protein [Streptomyces venezuelae]